MSEVQRILEENLRRRDEVDSSIYAAWQPGELFMRQGRERVAVAELRRLAAFPSKGQRCLEIGYGTGGWLPTLLGWGMDLSDLYGIELDRERADAARRALPGAHLEVGDGRKVPWEDDFFELVVVSTVLTSILDPVARTDLAREVWRVLKPGSAALLYDFRYDNPSNPNVRSLKRAQIRALFPEGAIRIRSVTLAPPVARAIAPRSWTVATVLECLPFLRTHLVTVVLKPGASETEGLPDA